MKKLITTAVLVVLAATCTFAYTSAAHPSAAMPTMITASPPAANSDMAAVNSEVTIGAGNDQVASATFASIETGNMTAQNTARGSEVAHNVILPTQADTHNRTA